jgi:hypothetical protein
MALTRKHRYGFAWVTLAFFAVSITGHWVFGWFAYVSEARQHAQAPSTGEFLVQILRDTFENWQSEFLQLLWQVAGLAWLWYVGSPQSSEGQSRVEGKLDFLLEQTEAGRARRRQLDEEFPRE